MKKWSENPEHIKELFEILANLKGYRRYKNSVEWKDHCAIAAKMLSNKYNEKITSNQVEFQTFLPSRDTKNKYGPAMAKNLAYAILSGFLTHHELNDLIEGKISYKENNKSG